MLDEPTAALGVAQTKQVLDLVRRLADNGLGFPEPSLCAVPVLLPFKLVCRYGADPRPAEVPLCTASALPLHVPARTRSVPTGRVPHHPVDAQWLTRGRRGHHGIRQRSAELEYDSVRQNSNDY